MSENADESDVINGYVWCQGSWSLLQMSKTCLPIFLLNMVNDKGADKVAEKKWKKTRNKINIETRRSTTLKQRVILVQGPC